MQQMSTPQNWAVRDHSMFKVSLYAAQIRHLTEEGKLGGNVATTKDILDTVYLQSFEFLINDLNIHMAAIPLGKSR